MGKYILKKIGLGIVLIFCVSFLVFGMLYMMPGDGIFGIGLVRAIPFNGYVLSEKC